jgi:hypothetical protein
MFDDRVVDAFPVEPASRRYTASQWRVAVKPGAVL